MNAITPARYLRSDPEARDAAIERATEALMLPGAEYDPLDPDNFDEALSETLAAFPVKNDLSAKLAAALRSGEPVNALLTDMAQQYWHALALRLAEDQVEAEREKAMEDRYEDRRDHDREDAEFWQD